ncbi:MAG TPA: hypothetical protein VGA31_04945 [Thermoanaerobaculia bacterium]
MFRRALMVALVLAGTLGTARAANSNGSGGDMPAFYDDQLFTINFKELSSNAEVATLRSNHSINVIYMCDSCEGLISGGDFVSVLDAIQGDGFNPLWQEVQVMFNAGFTPRQLTSDTDILAAAQAGEITLIPTNEVYRCSVVGPKK